MRHDDAAQGPREIAGGEDAEGLQLLGPFGQLGREEQLPDDGREIHEDDEVVEFERAAQGRQTKGAHILAGEGLMGGCGLLADCKSKPSRKIGFAYIIRPISRF